MTLKQEARVRIQSIHTWYVNLFQGVIYHIFSQGTAAFTDLATLATARRSWYILQITPTNSFGNCMHKMLCFSRVWSSVDAKYILSCMSCRVQ